MTTKLDELEGTEVDTPLDENNLRSEILDTSRPQEVKMKALSMYYETQGRENTIEVINTLGMMYELSGTRSLRQYLYDISCSSLDPLLKSFSAKALWSHDNEDELAYKAISLVYPLLENASTPYRIDLVKILMRNEKYKQESRNYFCEIINNNKIDCAFRYRSILSLEKGLGQEMETGVKNKFETEYFVKEACLAFAKNKENLPQYRILACQNLLKMREGGGEIENILFSLSEDKSLEYNLRADATDVILQYGSEKGKEKARKIIMLLGTEGKRNTTVYNNAQNVHVEEIETSVQEGIEFLQNFEVKEMKSFEYIRGKITEIGADRSENCKEKIEVSLNRIELDRALYSKYNLSLIHIIVKLWAYISGHSSEQELKKRLIEELVEMSGTCSSGFASRLVNVMSGFGDFSIRISWRDQMTGNLTARLNSRIQEMDDTRLQEKILEQMTLETSDYERRKHFLKFLRANISEIRGELYEEYKAHISDSDFDLYFRSALSVYETGQFT